MNNENYLVYKELCKEYFADFEFTTEQETRWWYEYFLRNDIDCRFVKDFEGCRLEANISQLIDFVFDKDKRKEPELYRARWHLSKRYNNIKESLKKKAHEEYLKRKAKEIFKD